MAYFRVTLHGSGIALRAPIDGHIKPIRSFSTTRVVKADAVPTAREKAVGLVLAEWQSAASLGASALPDVHVVSVEPARFIDWLRVRNAGYAFREDDSEPSAA